MQAGSQTVNTERDGRNAIFRHCMNSMDDGSRFLCKLLIFKGMKYFIRSHNIWQEGEIIV